MARWQEFRIIDAGEDIRAVKQLSERAGWNQTVNDLISLTKLSEGNYVGVISIDGNSRSLGSGAAYRIGRHVFWIGMILVFPEYRRQGIASAIMKHCMKNLIAKHEKHIIGLDATSEGYPLYSSLGFVSSFRIWRCKISMSEKIENNATEGIQALQNFSEIKQYAMDHGYRDRVPLLEILFRLSKDSAFVIKTQGKIDGFVLSRPGSRYPYIGPLVAHSEKVAGSLIKKVIEFWKKSNQHTLFMDIPEMHLNDTLFGYARPAHIEKVRFFERMYYLDGKNSGSDALTKEYMRKENKDWLEEIYAIGGPECS